MNLKYKCENRNPDLLVLHLSHDLPVYWAGNSFISRRLAGRMLDERLDDAHAATPPLLTGILKISAITGSVSGPFQLTLCKAEVVSWDDILPEVLTHLVTTLGCDGYEKVERPPSSQEPPTSLGHLFANLLNKEE